jgi:hypothetical protein
MPWARIIYHDYSEGPRSIRGWVMANEGDSFFGMGLTPFQRLMLNTQVPVLAVRTVSLTQALKLSSHGPWPRRILIIISCRNRTYPQAQLDSL